MVDQPARELADDDLVCSCRLLEPGGDADGFAGDEPLSRVGRRGDDLAGLDADPHLEPDAVVVDEPLVERGHSHPDVEGGARGAKCVVLVRERDAERGHDGVSRELLDRPAVTRQGGRDGLEVALEDLPERLGVERLRERHRLDDVDEEDRDEPPELHRRLGERSLLEQQRLVLAQDRGLERLELGAGVDAELLDQRLARRAVGGERVRLAPGAVEREHELGAGALAEWLRLDERLELGDELGVAAEREIRVDALLQHDRAELLEPCDLGLCERLVEEVGERGAPPEDEGLAENGRR